MQASGREHAGAAERDAKQEACVICLRPLGARTVLTLGHYYFRCCEECKSWTCLPRPDARGQAAIHNSGEYFEHPYFQLRRAITPSQRRRCRAVFERLSTAIDARLLRGERLLDVGCDTGTFLKAAQEEFGGKPVGIDVASRSVEEARRQGIEAYCTTLEEAPPQLAGLVAITAIDLIEHVADPVAFLAQIHLRLKPGGVAYLETPNIQSAVYRVGVLLARLAPSRAGALLERLFPRQHVQYFTPRSFRDLADRAGLEVVSLTGRVLPASHIAASRPVLAVITALQACDRILGTEILASAVLRRPAL
jgi:2-polyprenyl-3-methyl-5-hydroxy-6-metoxy-1,4-benzoquinol methylase